jgi:hypothetical protein
MVPFVLYSLRHTFLTRLGESGCDAWTLARIAGHSSISISQRYVHPSQAAVLAAVERLGRHNTGHSTDKAQVRSLDGAAPKFLLSKEKDWSGREDLNLRPPGPEPGALPG